MHKHVQLNINTHTLAWNAQLSRLDDHDYNQFSFEFDSSWSLLFFVEIKLQKCDLMGKPLIRNLQQLEHDPRSIRVLIIVQYRHRPMCTPEDCTSYQVG